MAEDIEVTAAEIARLAGVGRAAVSNWRRRHDDFPHPSGGTGTSPSFKLADVESWLRDQGKLAEIPLRERVWRQLDALRGDRPMASLMAALGVFLHYLRGAGRVALRKRTDEDLATDLLPAVAQAQPRLAKFLPSRLEPKHIALLRAVSELVEADGVERTFEQLSDRFGDEHGRQLAATPKTLATLMADLLVEPVSSVLDPACGSGALLATAAGVKSCSHVYGQEIDSSLAALATVRTLFGAGEAEIQAGDSLRADEFADLVVDAVVCNPPFNDRHWGHEELTYDSRWEYGLPPKGESELAWLQHCLAHVRPGGSVVVLMPPAASSRRSGKKIREMLVRRGALHSVIALPPGVAPPYGIPLSIWVLRRPAESQAPQGVLFVDLAEEQADLSAIRTHVVPLVSGFLSGRYEGKQGLSRVVATIDLLDEEVDLTPARHMRPTVAPTNAADMSVTRHSLIKLLGDLASLMPTVEPANGASGSPAMTSISELARSGAVVVRHQLGRKLGEADIQGTSVLRARDVVAGSAPSGVVAEHDGFDQWTALQPGDVVVAVLDRRVAVRVISEPGALLGSQLHLLRPDQELVDPWFLAGFIRGSAGRWVSGSPLPRLDIRRVEVPRLSITEQRRYGATFRKVHEFEDAIRRTATLGGELVRAMVDGLATGELRPENGPNG